MKKVYYVTSNCPGFDNPGLFFSNLKKAVTCYWEWCSLPRMSSYSSVAHIIKLRGHFREDFTWRGDTVCYIQIELGIVL